MGNRRADVADQWCERACRPKCRGTGRTTVFDLFGPTGAFVGELRVPAKVQGISIAGAYLATATERGDGVPVVVLRPVR